MAKKNNTKGGSSDAGKKANKLQYVFPKELYELYESTKSSSSSSSSYRFIPSPEVQFEDKIILIPNFFDKSLCIALTQSFGDKSEQDYQHMEEFSQRGTRDYAPRYNDRFQILNDDIANKVMWPYLKEILLQNEYITNEIGFNDAKGLNSNLRCYRYTKGHHFGKHYDESVDIANTNFKTKWTLLVYLTGGEQLIGGNTVFYSSYQKDLSLSVHPVQGMALLHKHGVDCLLHEAEMVTGGVKWVLRSDVYF